MDEARVRVTIRIEMDEHRRAASMLESLLPDNVGIPEGLSVDFHLDGRVLVLVFEVQLVSDGEISRRMASFIHTVDEVLDHINIMVNVMDVGVKS